MMPIRKFEDSAEVYEAAIGAKLKAAIRYSIAQSLVAYFPLRKSRRPSCANY